LNGNPDRQTERWVPILAQPADINDLDDLLILAGLPIDPRPSRALPNRPSGLILAVAPYVGVTSQSLLRLRD